MSSLTYLEACVGCSTESHAHASGAASCARCTEHGADAPSLVDQTRKTAAGLHPHVDGTATATFSDTAKERP
jgi:hypothetical protein